MWVGANLWRLNSVSFCTGMGMGLGLGMGLRSSYMLGKCSTSGPHLQHDRMLNAV